MSVEDDLRAEIGYLETRLRDQAASFCRAHQEQTDRANDARRKVELSAKAAEEAESELTALLLSTNEQTMPIRQRQRVIRALERVQRLRRTLT